MKKSFFAVLLLLALSSLSAMADARAMLNIKSPSALEANQGDLDILHRFFGSIFEQPLQSLFGINSGANVYIGYRYMIGSGIELNASYYWLYQEFTVGASYTYSMPFGLHTQADLQYFNLASSATERAGGVSAAMSLQTDPLWGLFSPVLVTGYDSYYNRLGFGAGLLVTVMEGLSVIAEVYPPFGIGGTAHTDELAAYATVSLGVRLDTFGHNFVFLVGNSYQMEERRLMAGSIGGPPGTGLGGTGFLNALYLGFNVHRRFDY